jgi:hypothetical protein
MLETRLIHSRQRTAIITVSGESVHPRTFADVLLGVSGGVLSNRAWAVKTRLGGYLRFAVHKLVISIHAFFQAKMA